MTDRLRHGPVGAFEGCGLAGVVREQHAPGIFLERRQEEDTLSTLRQAERAGVDDAICPAVAETFERSDDDLESASLRELEHEGYVFEKHVRNALLGDESKDFAHEAGARPFDPCRTAGLAEVLAREPRDQEIGPGRKRIEEANVFGEGDVREARLKDGTRRAIDLAEKSGLVTSPGQSELEAPDSGEEASRAERPPWAGHVA